MTPLSAEWWFDLAQRGGAIIAPFLLFALIWMTRDRNSILAELKKKSEKLESLTERVIVVMTELKGMLAGRRTEQ